MIARLLKRTLWSGAIGTATSTAALVVVAHLEGRGAAQPLKRRRNTERNSEGP